MRPREKLATVTTFHFDHFAVQNQIHARIKSTEIRRPTTCREFPVRNERY